MSNIKRVNYCILTLAEKIEIYQEFQGQNFFNHDLFQNLCQVNKIKNYKEFVKKGKKINLLELLNYKESHKKINQCFPCLFFDNYQAWVTVNEEGNYVYFSKNKKNNEDAIVQIDIVDFIEIFFGKNIEEVFNETSTFFYIKEKEWREEKKHELAKSKIYIERFTSSTLKDILLSIHTIALSYNLNSMLSKEDSPIFFISTRYIAAKINRTHSYVAKQLKELEALGFISKLNKDVIETLTLKKRYQPISAFTILQITEENRYEMANKIENYILTKIKDNTYESKQIMYTHIDKIIEWKKHLTYQDIENNFEKKYHRGIYSYLNEKYKKVKPNKNLKKKYSLTTNHYLYLA